MDQLTAPKRTMEAIVLGGKDWKPDLSMKGIAELVDEMRAIPGSFRLPVKNHFTPGMYARECHMQAGLAVVSAVHKTEHPYVISKGKIMVWTPEDGVVTLEAPYFGITKAGTVRLLYAVTDTTWTTFHPNPENKTDIDELVKDLSMEPREALALQEKANVCQLES
jgi:hypothetical protein